MNGMTTRISNSCKLAVLLILTSCTISVAKSPDKAECSVMTIAEQGKPTATIIISSKAPDLVKDAVKDLQLYIEKMSGAKLPISNSPTTQGNLILVGRMPEVNKLIPDLDEYDLGPDGIVIRQLPGKLIVTGQSGGYYHNSLGWIRGVTDAGTPNAIYYFLETLGCRWYMPGQDGEVVPHKPTIIISGMNIISKPDFNCRWIGCSAAASMGDGKYDSKVLKEFHLWRIRNRISHNTYYQAHSLSNFNDKYAKSHPEYFAFVNGERKPGAASALCLSNPDVTEIASKNLIDVIANQPPLWRSYSVGQADGPSDGWCKCEKCLDMYGNKMFTYRTVEEASTVGRAPSEKPVYNVANGCLKFVNTIAEKAESVNPNVLLTYYTLYNIPGMPTVKPRDSILPVMCHVKPKNKFWRRQVEHWAKISKHLYYYTYMGHLIDFPKLNIADDIRWCYEHKGIAMYLEHDAHTPINTVALYLASKALWDTNIDSKKVLAEFYREYYGEAEKPMQKFYETFYHLIKKATLRTDCLYKYPDTLTPKAAAKCRQYLVEASSLAKKSVVERRVEMISAYWRATELQVSAQHTMAVWRKDKTSENHKVAKQAVKETIDYITSVQDKFNITGRLRSLEQWRKEVDVDVASVVMELPIMWRFKKDPSGVGIEEKWFAESPDSSWVEISTSKDWTSQGHDYHGAAWYSTSFTLPTGVKKDTRLALYFGAVDGYADIFLEGVKIGEQKKDVSLMWEEPFTILLPPDIKQGKTHHLVLRVEKDRLAAGIWKPVRIIKAEAQQEYKNVLTTPGVLLNLSGTKEEIKPPIYLTDMSKCEPQSALSKKSQSKHWRLVEYESEEVNGTMILVGPLTKAPEVTYPLNVKGWHAIYVGYWPPHFGFMPRAAIKVRLKSNPYFITIADEQQDALDVMTMREAFWKYADLTGEDIVFGQQIKFPALPGSVAYLKLVPLSDNQVKKIKEDRADKSKRTVIASNDGGFVGWKNATTREDICEQVEIYRDSDVGRIDWSVVSGEITKYPSKIGFNLHEKDPDDCYREYDKRFVDNLRTLISKGLVPHKVAMKHAHSMGIKFYYMFRMAMGEMPPPMGSHSNLFAERPDLRLVDRDGTSLPKMSFAFPQVQQRVLDLMREVIDDEVDGINICWIRGLRVIGYEKPVAEAFKKLYEQDIREVSEDDERLYRLQATFITDFMRKVRQLTNEIGQRRGRPLAVTAMLSGTLKGSLKSGCDIQTWVEEKLVDELIAAAVLTRYLQGHGVREIIYAGAYGPDEYYNRAVDYAETGADGIFVWDMNGKHDLANHWALLRRLGHPEEIIDPESDTLNIKRIQLKTVGGIDVAHTQPWGGSRALVIYTGG